MPSYKTFIILSFSILFFSACATSTNTLEKKRVFKQVTHKEYINENQYIILALEFENFKEHNNARVIYKKLFDETNKYEYFVRYLRFSFSAKDYNGIKSSVEKYYVEDIKEEEEILKWYIYALSSLKDKKQAIKWAKKLVKKYENALSYEILAKVYYDNKEYKKSYENFKKSNEIRESLFSISTMANIDYYFLGKKQKAIDLLKQTIDLKEYDYTLSLQLIRFYEKSEKYEELVSHIKQMYLFYNKIGQKRLLNSVKKLFIFYGFRMEPKYIDSLIDFLEKTDSNDLTLLELYRKSDKKNKAYDFLEKAYAKEKNIDYLGQLAVLEFEMASDKKTVLDSVIEKFTKVLETSNRAEYQNYLAYLLIDYDLDIKKGLALVKKALVQEPKNLAYLDTLAWGEYKLNNCKKAYTIMKDIVKEAKFLDEEIKQHWEKIKECNK